MNELLVPVSHTAGQPQLCAAEEYAHALQADVLLVHVLSRGDARREAAAQAYLDTLVEYLASRCIRARAVVRTGKLTRTVVTEAALARAAAIVLGVSRRPGLLSGLIGNVSSTIAGAAPCPVILVQRPRSADSPAGLWDFGDAVKRAGLLSRRLARPETVDVARIVGSVDRATELGADFRPHRGARRKLDDQRLERIRHAIERGRAATRRRVVSARLRLLCARRTPPRRCRALARANGDRRQRGGVRSRQPPAAPDWSRTTRRGA